MLAAAALRTPPRDLIVSGLPAHCAGAAVKVLATTHAQLPGAGGPRSEAEAFAQCWVAGTGASVHRKLGTAGQREARGAELTVRRCTAIRFRMAVEETG